MSDTKMLVLKVNAIRNLFKKAGQERVSKDALIQLSKVLEQIGLEICQDAMDFMEHTGRQTIMERDIDLANERFRKKFTGL